MGAIFILKTHTSISSDKHTTAVCALDQRYILLDCCNKPIKSDFGYLHRNHPTTNKGKFLTLN